MSDMIMLNLGPSAGNDDYLTLGRTIAAQCPIGFAEARLDAEMSEGGADLQLHCTPDDGEGAPVELDAVAKLRLVQLLGHIRDKMSGEGDALWRKCTIVLRKGGRFQMDVAY